MAQYRLHPSEHLRKQIMAESENCWKIADSAVLTAQLATEGKIRQIRLFYLVLSLYAVNTLLIIWFVYTFVRKNLEYYALHDAMTGLLNRRSYEEHMEKELARCRRYSRTMSLIIFDIDYFKTVNDTYGHKTGDAVLIRLARSVRDSVRKTDSVFRVGGEEFVIIMPEAGVEEAAVLAEKIRNCVENQSFSPVRKLTVSMGIAESDGTVNHSDLYRQADTALYRAKENGRNKVEIYAVTMG
ncbi:MAG: GGDEF domain-containing protein [Desulfococcaceae bacterium]